MVMIDFTINQEEIIQEHCENIDRPELNCDGHCYLKKELQSIDDNLLLPGNSGNEKTNKSHFNTDWYSEVNSIAVGFILFKEFNNTPTEKNLFSEVFKSKIYQPPRV